MRPSIDNSLAAPLETAGVIGAAGLTRAGVSRSFSVLRIVGMPEPVRLLAFACVLGGLYALGALLPFWFLGSPEGGAAFFPAAGLTLSALVLSPRRTWPLWLGVVAFTEVVVDLTHGQSVVMSLGFALANTVEPLVGALGLQRVGRRHETSLRSTLVLYLVYGVVAGPIVGASLATSVVVLFGQATDWASLFGTWWLGDALGVLVVATPILTWRRRSPFEARAGLLETGAMVLLATGVTVLPAIIWHHPMIYAVLPVLIWAALRGGTMAVSAAGVGVAFAVDWAAVTGRAEELIAAASTESQLVFMQLFLAVTLLTALTLAVEVAERRRVEQSVRAAEEAGNRAELAAVETAEGERRRIARETHDIVGHALNVMLLHAGAARRALDLDIDVARECLESIEVAGRPAFGDLDIALMLADSQPDSSIGRGLSSVPDLIDVLRQAGMDVGMEVEGQHRQITTLVDWSAYRIIQEALTNVAKHAPQARAQVTIRFEPDLVALSVVDDGANRSAADGDRVGRGVIGMRERVSVLAGTLEIGPHGRKGFAVRARLPARSAEL